MGHLGAGGGEFGQGLVLLGLEVVGPVQQHPGELTRGDVALVGVRAALVDVLVQEVQAAGEAEGFDLLEEVLDGDGGVLGPTFVQVLAVGVDEAGAVVGDMEHALGPVGAGVTFDGVQGELQTPGAFEQADTLSDAVGAKSGTLEVDGQFGPATCAALQRVLNDKAKAGPEVDSAFGPLIITALQRYVKSKADGIVGPETATALQRHLGSTPSGTWDADTTRLFQKALNAGSF